MDISKETKRILDLIEPSMLVGGFVRDSVLGIKSNDIDIVTLLTPTKVIDILTDEGIHVIPTGIKHGTVTAVYNDQPFEITTARKDIKTDGRHAEVEFSDNFEDDANRRDFTFNALYAKPNGEITDFTGGLEDLKTGKVKFIGEADKRIDEDYLRILRFFRFYARFSKIPPEDDLLEIIEQKANLLRNLSAERITNEILKILEFDDIEKTLSIMEKTGVLQAIGLNGDISFTAKLPANAILRLYSLGGGNLLQNSCFVFSNKQSQYFKQILRSENIPFSDENLVEKSYFVGQNICVDTLELLAVKNDDEKYKKWAVQVKNMNVPVFPVTGEDLIALGFIEGKDLGITLKKAENWWVLQGFSSKEDTIKYIMGDK